MDPATLVTFLAPFLPYLLKAGEKASEEAGKKLGEKFGADTWEKSKSLWSKLRPKVETEEGVKVAVNKVAEKPESEVWKAALQEEFESLLKSDSALTDELAHILGKKTANQVGGTQIQQTVTRNQGQVIGHMQNSEAKNIGSIGNVQRDVHL
jgi:hypothetical protein